MDGTLRGCNPVAKAVKERKMFTEKCNLANEGYLTSSLLGNGLNALRKADLYNKGLYYQAFFHFLLVSKDC